VKHLLIVDDERGSRESLRAIFGNTYDVSLAASAEEAVAGLSKRRVDLVLLDVIMPRRDGLSLLKDIHELYPDAPVIMVSASTSVRPVVEAIRDGAYDYVTKPFDVEEIRQTVQRALESSTLQRRVAVLESELSEEYPIDGIVGAAPSFRKALADARKAAETDATVLITGESGTGKELVARSVHAWSSRRDEPFVAVHCAALPESLIESELFGHEKGAFTSADRQKAGRFDLAGAGTLFFDEVSEMPASTQVKLLRVLQEREFMRVGGTRVIRTDARIVAATGKDLRAEVEARRFRDDLFYRLSVVPVRLPPLRERSEDVPLLARYFLDLYRVRMDARPREFSHDTMACLLAYRWPGNVRELRNIIERMLVLHGREDVIRPEFLPEEFGLNSRTASPDTEGLTLAEAVNGFEKQIIEDALAEAHGVQTAAAEKLGTTRRILKYRMEKLKIRVPNGNG
jgi:DNA-binding NtrC family response regulator